MIVQTLVFIIHNIQKNQVKFIEKAATFNSVILFQFSSNGKADAKTECLWEFLKWKRSSFNSLQTGKYVARGHRGKQEPSGRCFNSLQTGKYVASGLPATRPAQSKLKRFQFPSNGKVCSKEKNIDRVNKVLKSFNSLQTGKYVASWWAIAGIILLILGFNSLQTGKGVARST